MHWLPDFIRFASEATVFGLWGGGMLLLSLTAFIGDRRRMRRKRIDAVGFMPWTAVFFLAFFPGVTLLALGVMGWLGG